jgi:hypothetical protein
MSKSKKVQRFKGSRFKVRRIIDSELDARYWMLDTGHTV